MKRFYIVAICVLYSCWFSNSKLADISDEDGVVNSKDTSSEQTSELNNGNSKNIEQFNNEKLSEDSLNSNAKEIKPEENILNFDDADKEVVENPEVVKQREELYHQGMEIVNSSKVYSEIINGYEHLQQAADKGHKEAKMEMAFAKLYGYFVSQNLSYAQYIFETQAKKGSPRAQAGLAFLYGTGIMTNSSQAKSLIYMTFSAFGNDVMGQMMLAYRHSAGVGITQNCESALIYYKKVADVVAGSVLSNGGPMVHRIRLIDEVENPSSSSTQVDDDLIQYYKFLADKGDVQAQVGLAQLRYQGGRGFEQNEQQAFEYFQLAADAGNAIAQAYLGKMHAEGSKLVPQNNETALKLFEKAANQGNPVGQAGLATMYLDGRGVDVDYKKAFKYFQLSADQGWVEGQLHMGDMFFHGKGVKRDYKQALRYYNLASQSGNILALHHLAQMQASGVGVSRSCHLSVELFKNVCERGKWSVLFEQAYNQYNKGNIDSALVIYVYLAELGYEIAQSNVAFILDQHESTLLKEQTLLRALLYWGRAATQGNTIARVKLGDYHYYGYGTLVDYETAAMHYKLAYEQSNNPQAMFNLGYMHEQGLGMKKDIHLAKRFYDLAAEASVDAQAPVSLALIKIGVLFGLDFIKHQKWSEYFHYNWINYISNDWDIYLMTFLALVLGFILAFRRQQQQLLQAPAR